MSLRPSRCLCGGDRFTRVFAYNAPPAGEVRCQGLMDLRYERQVFQCDGCGHYLSIHNMRFCQRSFYEGKYVDSTYGSNNGIHHAFQRIASLDEKKSDNAGRVGRIQEFAEGRLGISAGRGRHPTVLDVGSGLCVFLHRMKGAGWRCTALDPDARSVRHARETVGIGAVCGDFMKVKGLGRFDLVTFNKVLEHVPDPIAMLAKASRHVKPRGFVYVELPDGEAASVHGQGREEFFIEHLHVFSFGSAARLFQRSGFKPLCMERLQEPSGKYTLRAFLIPAWTRSIS